MALRKTNNPPVDVRREIDDIRQGLAELEIEVTDRTIACFETYITILHEYRERVHLLSRRDYGRISRRHFLASLVAYPYVKKHEYVCDVGAGAGFPSVPLKIVLPAIDCVLFESNRKKAEFLRELVDRLSLERMAVINSRAEDYAGQGFDMVLLKAAGKIDRMMKVVDALVAPGGEAIFFKTRDVGAELRRAARAIEKKGFSAEVKEMSTPVEKIPMALVIMHKL